jgi:hypothetical protein
MPWINYFLAIVFMILDYGQLIGFAVAHDTLMPEKPALPIRTLQYVSSMFQTFGIQPDINFGFFFCFAAFLVIVSAITFWAKERLQMLTMLNPDSVGYKYTFLGVCLVMKVVNKGGMIPVLKILLYSLSDRNTTSSAEYSLVVPLIGIGLAFLQLFLSVRMSFVDFELKHIHATVNPFDWSEDNTLSTSRRVQRHPLITPLPLYDQFVLATKTALLLANMFLPGSTFGGILCISMRLGLSFSLMLVGIKYKKFFPGKFCNIDVNVAQTFLDASFVLANSFALAHVSSLSMATTVAIMAWFTGVLMIALQRHGIIWRSTVEGLEEPLLRV